MSSLTWSVTVFVFSFGDYRTYYHTLHLLYSSYRLLGLYSLDCKSLHTWILFVFPKQYVFFPSLSSFLLLHYGFCCFITVFWAPSQWCYGAHVHIFSVEYLLLRRRTRSYPIISWINNFPGSKEMLLYSRYMFVFVLPKKLSILNMMILASLLKGFNARKTKHPVLRESLK